MLAHFPDIYNGKEVIHVAHRSAQDARQLARQVGIDFGAALAVALGYIGDRLGIFKVMGQGIPMTSVQLAERTRLNERYIREWASTMAAAGYIEYEPVAQTFQLNHAQRTVLLDEHSPFHMPGAFQYAVTCYRQIPRLTTAFRDGGGIPFADFGPEIAEAIRRMFQAGYEKWVAREWIPAIPEIHQRLIKGGEAAEVGCGGGQCLIPVAQAFTQSRFVGFDVDSGSIEHARNQAAALGLGDRVEFAQSPAENMDACDRFDLMMAFNCIHDMANPRGALRACRQAIKPDGVMLWSEAQASDRLEDNLSTWGRSIYGASTMHCMTVSLAHNGEGLGCVIGERLASDLAQEAGFATIAKLPVENPFHQVFVLRK
jgi:2-polyprenyl-3-methyl-5-hydroxy-6-metoxy-1,4-benzoquinol methylase